MYTVIVVEDEQELRRAIIEKVDWTSAGFKVIADAENGIEALDLIEQLEPDLVMTDIKMPMMTGLELAEQVREIRPATGVVILSGYDDFEYARAAIKYNIISYLLKPISAEELSKELLNIRKSMDRRFSEIRGSLNKDFETLDRRLKISEFLLPLLLGNTEELLDEDYLAKTAYELDLAGEVFTPYYSVLISKFKNKEGKNATCEEHIGFIDAVLNRYVKNESFFVSGRIVTLITTKTADTAELLQLPLREIVQNAARVLGEECTVGISRAVDTLSLCGNAYSEAVAARRYTADGAGDVRFIADSEHGNVGDFEKMEKSVFKLEHLLKVGNSDELNRFLEELGVEQNGGNDGYFVIQILSAVYRTVSEVSDRKGLSQLLSENPVYSKISLHNYDNAVRSDIKKLCNNAKEIISCYRKQDTEIICDKVIQIIDSEYAREDLSLTEVSSRLNVSPNYLSALIKKTKKNNFINLLTERRMKAAYDMLICTPMKILEISERSGYSDQHYFSYCFKKYYGVSPNKMRENKRSVT